MLYKIFYSLLMGISPWMASFSLPSGLSKSPQVEWIEKKQVEESQVAQKEQEAKESVQKWARGDEDVLHQLDLFLLS